ncbi:hypothetical protein GH714_036148 [Hevea brasiliensis]|uniref:Alpha/beta hydrolase fold-3 domain-containing protein n=1 Tax=Hevea brasiliensis TaxID=3981 RepID=A0A6A6N7C3_HEVBR|nr:hypothetical protein GH714_036148 [Hevea brasiliensis]
MDSTLPKVVKDLSPILKIYEDGRVERLLGNDIVPPSLDPEINVQSKDVVYFQEANLSSRLYLPKSIDPSDQKLPLLVYFHEAKIIAVSVDYRRAPEHPLSTVYDDSWSALQWVASHVNGNGPEEWLNLHADFGKVFLAGDSAGANISHHMALRYDEEKLSGIILKGIVLIHPYFWGKEPVGDEPKDPEIRSKIDAMWLFVSPTTSGLDDPLINPAFDPKLARLGCSRVLVIVAEKDILKNRLVLLWNLKRVDGKDMWKSWRLRKKNMCSICSNLPVRMLWPCSKVFLLISMKKSKTFILGWAMVCLLVLWIGVY